MTSRPFRFAVQGTPQDAERWLGTARRAEELGYSTLMMPDGMQLLLGQPATSAAERLAQVEQTIDDLRTLDGDQHTPVLMAAGGPKARAVAAAKADIVTLAIGPLTSRDEAARLVAGIRDTAGDRADQIEFALPIFVVGDEAPSWIQRFLETDVAALIATDSLMILRGGPQEMADELQRRRDNLGLSYFSVNAAFSEQFAPVVELLAGR